MAKAIRVVSKDNDGNEKIVIVKKPTHSQLSSAQMYSASIFNKAKNSGACLRRNLDDYLRKEAIITKEQTEEIIKLSKEINDKLRMLKTKKDENGAILKLTAAKDIALRIRVARLEQSIILAKQREYDAYTVEGQSENAHFDYLVSCCTFDEKGERIFQNIEDYYEKQEEEYAVEAAAKLSNVVYGLDEDWNKKQPENQFLLKYKFIDDDLRFINKEGKWVDIKGNLVNKEGQALDEAGELKNKPAEEDETVEFIDDVVV